MDVTYKAVYNGWCWVEKRSVADASERTVEQTRRPRFAEEDWKSHCRKGAMKLPLVASILLASAYASVWPYHEAVGVHPPPDGLLVAPAYAVGALANLPEDLAPKDDLALVAGPTSGPTLVQGASAGPVTLIAPSDGTSAIGDITETEAAVGSAAGAVLADGSSVRAGSVTVAENDATSQSGVVSAEAVIGPSTGAVVIAGPTAVPAIVAAPITVATDDVESASAPEDSDETEVTLVVDQAGWDVSASNSSLSDSESEGSSAPDSGPNLIAHGLIAGATVARSSVSSSASVTRNSENSPIAATAEINLVASAPAVAIAGEASLRNGAAVSAPAVPTVVVSGSSGSISVAGDPTLPGKKQLKPLR